MRQPPGKVGSSPAGLTVPDGPDRWAELLTAAQFYLATVRLDADGLAVALPDYVRAAGFDRPPALPGLWRPVAEHLATNPASAGDQRDPVSLLADHHGQLMAIRLRPATGPDWLMSWQPHERDWVGPDGQDLLRSQAFGQRRTAAILDLDATVLAVEAGYQDVLGGPSPIGQAWPATLGPGASQIAGEILAELSRGGPVDRIVATVRERPHWLRVQGWPARRAGSQLPVQVLWIEDLTEATGSSLAAELIRDPLTGVYNRRAFLDLAALPAETTSRYRGVLLVDVRGFRRINELWGQQVGDDCLVETAGWLAALAGPTELVMRLSGSQFILLCTESSSTADRLERASSRTVRVDGRRIQLSLQAGWAARAPAGQLLHTAEEAETALAVAKRDAWRTVVAWTSEIAHDAGVAAAQEEAVQQAVAAHQEGVQFQPIVNLAEGRVSGVEALVRMGGPALELPTDRILAASHKLGLTPELAERVYLHAFAEGLQLQAVFPSCLVGVNVSREFLSTGLAIDTVLAAAQQTGLPLDQVVVELTEDVAAGLSTDLLTSELRRGAHAGLQLVIDDFGRGETSLSLLRQLPLSGIKLDRSLLPLDDDDRAWQFVAASISLLGQLTSRIIAEGIETPLQSRRLRELGIHLQQGYLFGQPATSGYWLQHGLPIPAE